MDRPWPFVKSRSAGPERGTAANTAGSFADDALEAIVGCTLLSRVPAVQCEE